MHSRADKLDFSWQVFLPGDRIHKGKRVVRAAIIGIVSGLLVGLFLPGREGRAGRMAVAAKPVPCRKTIEVPVLGVKVYQTRVGKGVTRANAAKIKAGMTAKEIGNLLGGPPGDLIWKRRVFVMEWHGRYPKNGEYGDFWMDDKGVLQVLFRKDRRAKEWWFFPWVEKPD
jgi:hypothetical protein